MIAIIIVLVLLGLIVYSIYPAISAPHASEFTTQDSIEDVITDENTIYVKQHKKGIKKEIVEATTITTNDFVEKEIEFKDTAGGRQLTEHIAKVIELNPNSKKHLTKRQRKTVDKIVKEKK